MFGIIGSLIGGLLGGGGNNNNSHQCCNNGQQNNEQFTSALDRNTRALDRNTDALMALREDRYDDRNSWMSRSSRTSDRLWPSGWHSGGSSSRRSIDNNTYRNASSGFTITVNPGNSSPGASHRSNSTLFS